ncbi:MAG: DUF421 domain-containing protein [Verrucomicrobiota bacterium]|nr:DUF421 domain-containing protein [Verrucomicrobiota bacterium]
MNEIKNVILQSPGGLLRSAILLVGSYIGLIPVLRITGKRTLSKMNAFDLVVTVALGSTLATIALSKDTALLQGLLVLTLLVTLQFLVAWLSVRSRAVSNLVKATPVYLFKEGEFQEKTLLRERVTHDEIMAAARSDGFADLTELHAVILETDGSFSIIRQSPDRKSTLQSVSEVR